MVRLLIILGSFATCALTTRAVDPAELREYTSKDGRYKILMPREVDTSKTKSEAKTNPTETFTASAALPSGLYFSVSYFDLANAPPADRVKPLVKELSETSKEKPLSAKERTFGKDKLPAYEIVEKSNKQFLRQLAVIGGKRVYQVILIGPKQDAVTSKDANRYFESFEIVK